MKWYQELYVSDNIKAEPKTIRFLVEHGVQIRPLYLIVLSELEDGQLEIIPVHTLKLPVFRKKDYSVVGVAKGYYYARSLVERMVSDVYTQTGDCNVKLYFASYFDDNKGEDI